MTPEQEKRMQTAVEALSRDRRDEEAWRFLVTATWAVAIATANRTLKGALDLAEDAAIDAFARIARYTDFRLLRIVEPTDFVKYLKQVVRRCAYDLLGEISRHSREVPLNLTTSDVEPGSSTNSPEAMFAAAEMRAELTKTLTEDENRLLDLLLDGFTTEEIAQRLGISYDSSGVRLHRLRGKIRKLLTDKGIF